MTRKTVDDNVVFRVQVANKNFGNTKALDINQPENQPLEIYRGTITAILGHSGSGKSTFLSILGILEDPDPGVKIFYYPDDERPLASGKSEFDYSDLTESQKVEMRREQFGVAFQDGHLIGHMSVADNIQLPMALNGAPPREAKRVAETLAKTLDLKDKLAQRPKELSGGQYQRTAILRAMSHFPRVIFADEPTGNLDSKTAMDAMNMLRIWREESQNHTLILVTHDLHLALKYADQFLVFQDGRLEHKTSKADPEYEAHIFKWLQLKESNEEGMCRGDLPKEDHTANPFRRLTYLFRYGVTDLFPLKLYPFEWEVFKVTFRDTLFSLLAIASVAILVGVLLIGYGFHNGVNTFLIDQAKGIGENLVTAEIGQETKVDDIKQPLIDELWEELRTIRSKPSFLGKIVKNLTGKSREGNPKLAVEGIYGYKHAQIRVYKNEQSEITVPSDGHTVTPDSPLLKRLTYEGVSLPPDKVFSATNTKGLIVKKGWLSKIFGDTLPEKIYLNWGKRTDARRAVRHDIAILAVVDDLPSAKDFLIAETTWNMMNTGSWKQNSRNAELTVSTQKDGEIILSSIRDAMKKRQSRATVSFLNRGPTEHIILVQSNNDAGWTSDYWNKKIYKNSIVPILNEAGLINSIRWTLTGKVAGADNQGDPYAYSHAAIYLNDLSAVKEVGRVIRTHPARLHVNRKIEKEQGLRASIMEMFAVIFGVIGFCAFFLSTINIFLMFYQSVLRKRHEIGILKAFGCSRMRIASVYFIESMYIALCACVIGMFVGIYLGEILNHTLMGVYGISVSDHTFFKLPSIVAGGIMIFVIFLCLCITYGATFSASMKTANELLRQRD